MVSLPEMGTVTLAASLSRGWLLNIDKAEKVTTVMKEAELQQDVTGGGGKQLTNSVRQEGKTSELNLLLKTATATPRRAENEEAF